MPSQPHRQTPRRPPRALLWWESLSPAVQLLAVGPASVLLLWAAHVGLMNQPVGRGLGYGLFWGLLATAAIVGATRAEAARRAAGPGDEEPPRA